jgi:hypothetical protein
VLTLEDEQVIRVNQLNLLQLSVYRKSKDCLNIIIDNSFLRSFQEDRHIVVKTEAGSYAFSQVLLPLIISTKDLDIL